MPKADTLSKSANSSSSSSNLKLQPLGDRVIVKPVAKGEKTTSFGIIIPESTDKERPAKGTVVAVGPGKTEDGNLVPMNVKVGQQVLFSKYGYDEVKLDGEEYFILTESSILAIVTK
jgi:chaperonin GroES